VGRWSVLAEDARCKNGKSCIRTRIMYDDVEHIARVDNYDQSMFDSR
jgi:hypothetical protein